MDMPKKVDDDQVMHIVIMGPKKSGKSKLARNLSKEHRRQIINLDEILEWNISNNTRAA